MLLLLLLLLLLQFCGMTAQFQAIVSKVTLVHLISSQSAPIFE
jgi:hypothetical protein